MSSNNNHSHPYGQLFIVSTPIGHLADISYRAVETLKNVDLIAAEDTRTSRKLLQHYAIDTPMISCHEHNEKHLSADLLKRLQQGLSIALISDAGTPLINDPGYRLVKQLAAAHIDIIPIPGACSPIAALSVSGLATDRFEYQGFLPRSGKRRNVLLQHIIDSSITQIILESPRRLQASIQELIALGAGQRQACIGRELTKQYEEILRGSLQSLSDRLQEKPVRGEIVLLIDGQYSNPKDISDEAILDYLQDPEFCQYTPSERAKKLAKKLKISRSRIYQLLLNTA